MNRFLDPQSVQNARISGQLRIIDVRTPAEYGEIHIGGSIPMPLDRLDPKQVHGPGVLVCRSGKRAEQARRKLAAAGCENLAVLQGGILAWEEAGLPVERGKAVISLERQVRITAGLLILTGVGLGLLVHPALFGLAAFVGVGLIFAGLTDWCGMGLLLAKMPWNQRSGICCADNSCSI
jgi:rhodanese-related sulfurtransferase